MSTTTDLPPLLSGKFKTSFAYVTIKDRMPAILTKVVDTAVRQKYQVVATGGPEASEELKKVIGELSELRYRMATDKPIQPLNQTNKFHDVEVWNNCLKEEQQKANGVEPTWFSASWLYVECYMYRRIMSAFHNSEHLWEFDPFRFQKEQAFVGYVHQMADLGEHLETSLEVLKTAGKADIESAIRNLVLISLWGNRCDLSISAGQNQSDIVHPLKDVESLSNFVLADEFQPFFTHIYEAKGSDGPVDFVMDNVGFELFCDLCLAETLLQADITRQINFHVKAMPWFVSDTTTNDFTWTLEMLRASDHKSLNDLGHRWHKRLEDGQFVLKVHDFWTYPHPMCQMSNVAKDLYESFARSIVVFFKGDLNYRKLVGDRAWPTTTSFKTSLQGFAPAPLLALRTLKADVVVGLQPGQAELLDKSCSNWMFTGDYAVIQFFKP